MNDVILDFHKNLSRLFEVYLYFVKICIYSCILFCKTSFSLFLSSGFHFNVRSQYKIDNELAFAICSTSENVGV